MVPLRLLSKDVFRARKLRSTYGEEILQRRINDYVGHRKRSSNYWKNLRKRYMETAKSIIFENVGLSQADPLKSLTRRQIGRMELKIERYRSPIKQAMCPAKTLYIEILATEAKTLKEVWYGKTEESVGREVLKSTSWCKEFVLRTYAPKSPDIPFGQKKPGLENMLLNVLEAVKPALHGEVLLQDLK